MKDREIGRFSWILQAGPVYNHKRPCKRNAEGDWATQRRRRCDDEGGEGSDVV